MGQNSPFRGGLGLCGSKCPISQQKKVGVVETAVASLNIPFQGGIGAVWVRTVGGELFRGGVGAVWVKTAGKELFQGGMGALWSKWGRWGPSMGQNGGR